MILVSDVHVVPSPHVVADLDAEMTDYSATSTNQAPVTDTHHRIGNALLPWNHSSRQGDIGTNQSVFTDVDVLLVEDCGGLPHDEASPSKPAETFSPSITWGGRGSQLNPRMETDIQVSYKRTEHVNTLVNPLVSLCTVGR